MSEETKDPQRSVKLVCVKPTPCDWNYTLKPFSEGIHPPFQTHYLRRAPVAAPGGCGLPAPKPIVLLTVTLQDADGNRRPGAWSVSPETHRRLLAAVEAGFPGADLDRCEIILFPDGSAKLGGANLLPPGGV